MENFFGIDSASSATKTVQDSMDGISGATVRMSRESTSYQRALVEATFIVSDNKYLKTDLLDRGYIDDEDDVDLPHWAGVIPIVAEYGVPIPSTNLTDGIEPHRQLLAGVAP